LFGDVFLVIRDEKISSQISRILVVFDSSALTKQLAVPRQIHYSLGGTSFVTIFLPRWRSYIPDLVITQCLL
jgi:hypothetical protein